MKIKLGTVEENIITRDEFPLWKARKILNKETISVLGYGVQGPGQSLNLKDNGFQVIIGQRPNSLSWKKALEDGWIEGENLFSLEEASKRGTIIMYLLSDAGQISFWPILKKNLTEGKSLYFSHGFGLTFCDKTKIFPPKNIDIFLVAPKGSGTSLRRLFKLGKGINSSYAIYQDFSGKSLEKTLSIGIGIGSGYLFETSFKNEVYSDLVGERGTLMGAIQGIFAAQYHVLREKGHSPSESFNETVEELTQSLMPLVAEKGMDWMYSNCSTTAQRGALDWWKKFRDVTLPVFRQLYNEVSSGSEAKRIIDSNSHTDYRMKLEKELQVLQKSELWEVGKIIRNLRPKEKKCSSTTKKKTN
ncbi:ketol-acid reductoisomerase [Blattabacterium cuenoti]|uniref:ketol-acid reductoisomerase n=1 Tax=Blattabacterium cuenoti TaxID=1653831 RepID=UPI00163BC8F9|nr:ketol-acid reductoisomerase [Blattabacterium cuenoti]